jgi:tetratricopeptide (TPR) repeat protein
MIRARKSMTSEQPSPKHNKTNPITEGMAELLDELKLSTHWDRPSILMVVFRSKLTMLQAQISLKNKIRRIGQQVKHIRVNQENYDLALHLSERTDTSKTVFFISDLHNGGGLAGLNAFRALNMRRELLVDHSIRVVFWLSEADSTTMMLNAIDFWAFRHRLVELLNSPRENILPGLLHKLSELPWEPQNHTNLAPVDAGQLVALQAELKGVPNAVRFTAWLQISYAATLWADGNFHEAQNQLAALLAEVQITEDVHLQAECLAAIGQVFFSAGDHQSARKVLEKSLELDPKNSTGWLILAKIHHGQQRKTEMNLALERLLVLVPRNSEGWELLGDLQVSSNQMEEAARSYLNAQAGSSKNALVWKKLGDICANTGHLEQAGMYYRKACRLGKRAGDFLKLGEIYQQLNKSGPAIRAYKQAVRLEEFNPVPWEALGKLYRAEKHFRAEIKAFSKAAALAEKAKHSLI